MALLSGSESVKVSICYCLYVMLIILTGLTGHIFEPVPKQDLDFQCHVLRSFLCSMIAVVHFVDIGGIVDHYLLNFLFINKSPA